MKPGPGALAGMNRYDTVPYPGRPIPRSHVRRLETVAALFGLSPASPASARVLELGCGCGANLLPQALEYPFARFVGCDASRSAIASAGSRARVLGVQNVELRHTDLSDVDASWGPFDFIICSGVFSWVDPETRGRVLEILHTNLAPEGVGYVSYNTLPGWHLRFVVRELMRHHAAGFDDPAEAIAQAREALALVALAQHDDCAYAAVIREEYARLSHAEDGYLYHEMLTEYNQPLSCQEFFRHAQAAGLQYLGAADFPRMFHQDLPAAARAFLDGLPLAAREQHLDFVRGNAFRRDLLCHRALLLDRRLDSRDMDRFSAALTRDAQLELVADGTASALRLRAGRCAVPCPDRFVAALRHLDDRRPEFIPVRELRDTASCRSGESAVAVGAGSRQAAGQDGADEVSRFFVAALTAGALEVTLSAPCLTSRVSERPTANPLARLQAEVGEALTNQNHEVVHIGDVARLVVRLLDGTRDRLTVTEAVEQELTAGHVSPDPFDEAGDVTNVECLVHRVLTSLAREAILVA